MASGNTTRQPFRRLVVLLVAALASFFGGRWVMENPEQLEVPFSDPCICRPYDDAEL